jgi:hypothetical protein
MAIPIFYVLFSNPIASIWLILASAPANCRAALYFKKEPA